MQRHQHHTNISTRTYVYKTDTATHGRARMQHGWEGGGRRSRAGHAATRGNECVYRLAPRNVRRTTPGDGGRAPLVDDPALLPPVGAAAGRLHASSRAWRELGAVARVAEQPPPLSLLCLPITRRRWPRLPNNLGKSRATSGNRTVISMASLAGAGAFRAPTTLPGWLAGRLPGRLWAGRGGR